MKTTSMILALASTAGAIVLAGCATDGGGAGGVYLSRSAVTANGGAQLKADELRQTLAGAKISGPGHSSAWGNTDIELKLNPDGSVSGSVARINIQAGVYPMSGQWRVNGTNQACFDLIQGATGGSSGGKSPLSGCEDWFKVGSQLYAFQGNTGIRRTVSKQ